MIIQKYCSKRMTGNKITARTIVREKKLKRLSQKTYSAESKK
jgi:hypothetical protein|tara:strand:- start:109 stop:234 length:126 start_codon:yes stop_codon:yes gene_type:complete